MLRAHYFEHRFPIFLSIHTYESMEGLVLLPCFSRTRINPDDITQNRFCLNILHFVLNHQERGTAGCLKAVWELFVQTCATILACLMNIYAAFNKRKNDVISSLAGRPHERSTTFNVGFVLHLRSRHKYLDCGLQGMNIIILLIMHTHNTQQMQIFY